MRGAHTLNDAHGNTHNGTSSSSSSSSRAGWWERLTRSNKGTSYTSEDARGPQYGIGYDPVWNHMLFKQATGPLRRKQHGSASHTEDCFSVEESKKWMEVEQAARLLGISKEELSLLTREKLESRWVALYRQRNASPSFREEVLLATELLLEYLDSTMFVKKNRSYYQQTIENMRLSIDMELERDRLTRRDHFFWLCGVAALGACSIVLLIAVSKGSIMDANAREIGRNAGNYLTMSFLQPTNFEPPPDYNTRYFVTPSALELDQQAAVALQEVAREVEGEKGGGGAVSQVESVALDSVSSTLPEPSQTLLWEGDSTLQLRREVQDARRAEEDELLQLYNDHKAPTTTTTAAAAAAATEETGSGSGVHDNAVKTTTTTSSSPPPSFTDFASAISANFGGSRIERMTRDTSERIRLKDDTEKILHERQAAPPQ